MFPKSKATFLFFAVFSFMLVMAFVLSTQASATKKEQTVSNDLHYKCYKIEDVPYVDLGRAIIHNQFNSGGIKIVAPINLCSPAKKNGHGVFDPTDLKCYRITGPKADKQVKLTSEQFEPEVVKVLQVISLCTPANVAFAPKDPTMSLSRHPHYVCYYLLDGMQTAHPPVDITTRLFPIEKNVGLGKSVTLCVPSLVNFRGTEKEAEEKRKQLESAYPHLKCLFISGPKIGKKVNLRTRFPLEKNVLVAEPQALCVPVIKTVIKKGKGG